MKPYELTYIISSTLTGDETDGLKKDIETFIQEKGGLIVKSEKTAPQSFAYSIKKHASGYFITTEFQALESSIKELQQKLEQNVKVLRQFIIIKKPAKVMKERRTRKPLRTPEGEVKKFSEMMIDKNKGVKVELKDVEEKLDEILSE